MNQETKIICVACPKGCRLRVNHLGETFVISDQECKRGEEYAIQEMTDPRRMVATTIRLAHGPHPLLPVYTSAPFPKAQIQQLLFELRKIEISEKVKMGQPVLSNVLDTGIDILASRDSD